MGSLTFILYRASLLPDINDVPRAYTFSPVEHYMRHFFGERKGGSRDYSYELSLVSQPSLAALTGRGSKGARPCCNPHVLPLCSGGTF